MGEKIANRSFHSGGAVGSILELSLGNQKLCAKIVMVIVTDESQHSPAILVSENYLFCL